MLIMYIFITVLGVEEMCFNSTNPLLIYFYRTFNVYFSYFSVLI